MQYIWIYVNMASVSVYRSYAKCVLGTKTLTLPTQDNRWLSAPPTELCNYHDNHSQQKRDSAGKDKLRTRHLPVKASTKHCCLPKSLCQNSPLPTPLVLSPRPDPPTNCWGSPWAIQLYRPRWQPPYFFGHRSGLETGCALRQAKT